MTSRRLVATVALPLFFVGTLTACTATPEAAQPTLTQSVAAAPDSLLATAGLEGKSGREIVEALDQLSSPGRCR